MVIGRQKRQLLDIYINPQGHDIVVRTMDLEGPAEERLHLAEQEKVRIECLDDAVEIMVRNSPSKDLNNTLLYLTMQTDLDEAITTLLDKTALINTTLLPQCESKKITYGVHGRDDKRVLESTFVTKLPHGELLHDAIPNYNEAQVERLMRSIEALQSALVENKVSFKALTPEAMIVDQDGVLYPIRIQDMLYNSKGVFEALHTPQAQCEKLREAVAQMVREQCTAHATFNGDFTKLELGTYAMAHNDPFPGHIAHGYPHEERVWVQDETGFGFVNMSNQPIIEATYEWAGDFCEGRAIVKSQRGYGLIDTEGKIIIEPKYKGLSYDTSSGATYVKQGQKWGVMSYDGKQIEDFTLDIPPSNNEIYEL